MPTMNPGDPNQGATQDARQLDPDLDDYPNIFRDNDDDDGANINNNMQLDRDRGDWRSQSVTSSANNDDVPPLPPPVGGEAVVIPNNAGREDSEEVIIGPQMPQQVGVPRETVQLWEEVAYGLEKNQTGEFYILHCTFTITSFQFKLTITYTSSSLPLYYHSRLAKGSRIPRISPPTPPQHHPNNLHRQHSRCHNLHPQIHDTNHFHPTRTKLDQNWQL